MLVQANVITPSGKKGALAILTTYGPYMNLAFKARPGIHYEIHYADGNDIVGCVSDNLLTKSLPDNPNDLRRYFHKEWTDNTVYTAGLEAIKRAIAECEQCRRVTADDNAFNRVVDVAKEFNARRRSPSKEVPIDMKAAIAKALQALD